MHCLAGHGCRPQQKLGVRPKGAAGIRNDQAAAGARKKLYRERIFQRLDAGAHRGLADTQGFRCPMKTTESRYRKKSLNLVNLHDVPSGEFLHLYMVIKRR